MLLNYSLGYFKVVERVLISNDTSLTEGETALLACEAIGFLNVEITWIHDGQTVSNSSLVTVSEVQEERLIHQSFLKIFNVEEADAGVYTCIIRNGDTSVNTSTQLTVFCKFL